MNEILMPFILGWLKAVVKLLGLPWYMVRAGEPQTLWEAAKNINTLFATMVLVVTPTLLCKEDGQSLADTSPVGNRSNSHVPARMQVLRRWTVWVQKVLLSIGNVSGTTGM